MIILKGIAASSGYAIGRAVVMQREDVPVRERFVAGERTEGEVERFRQAVEKSKADVLSLQDRMSKEVGSGSAAIFGAHLWVLSDPTLHEEVLRRIRNNRFSAEYAIDRALQKFISRLRALDDPYLAQRVQDLEDIERRLLDVLRGGRPTDIEESTEPVVVVAHSLSPSQTASFDRSRVMGIATDVGGRTAHAAILSRDLGIPAVVGLEIASSDVDPGEMVVVDGQRGVLIISPDERTIEKYRSLTREYQGFEEQLTAESHLPAETRDGSRIVVFGNIEFPEEIPSVVEHGAEGIGLYRTEFLFLREGKVPREKDHIEAYRAALRFLGGRPIMIRTVDLGADKLSPHTTLSQEKNPFLGCRSIRLCQVKPDVFRTQLRAILRVSGEGDVKCMLPMITTVSELRWAKSIVEEVKAALRGEGVPFAEDMPIGIMIEVPAAAMMADSLAREADFFSIGTNDLIQYTLAVDRTNELVAHMFSAGEPSVLRLIKNVIDAAQRHDVDVSMCGEMAGDPVFVKLLLGMGLKTLSVAPAQAPQVKKLIRTVSMDEARALADGVLGAESREDVMAALEAQAGSADVQFPGGGDAEAAQD